MRETAHTNTRPSVSVLNRHIRFRHCSTGNAFCTGDTLKSRILPEQKIFLFIFIRYCQSKSVLFYLDRSFSAHKIVVFRVCTAFVHSNKIQTWEIIYDRNKRIKSNSFFITIFI